MGRWVLMPAVVVMLGVSAACRPSDKGADRGSDEGPGTELPAGEEAVSAAPTDGIVPDPSGNGNAASAAATAAVPAPVVVRWSPERAGFARYLPADTSIYLEARHLDALWDWSEQFQDSEAMEKLTDVLESPEKIADAAEAAGVEGAEEVPVEKLEELREQYGKDGWKAFQALFGEEFFVSARGMDWWVDPLVFYQEHNSRHVIAGVMEMMANGDFGALNDEERPTEELGKLGTRLRKRLEEADRKPVWGIYAGGKLGEDRTETLKMIQGWMAMGAEESEDLTAHSFEKVGVTWTGWKISWPDPGTSDQFETLRDIIEEDDWKVISEVIAEVPLIVACAEVEDHVVLYAGLGEHSLELAVSPEASLAGCEEFQFMREFEADAILGNYWVQEELVDALHRIGSSEPVWDGMAEGLAKSTRMDTAPLMAMSLKKIAALAREQEAGKAHAAAGCLVMDAGVRLEMRGGWHGVSLDLDAPLALAGAMHGQDDALLMRAHWKMSDQYVDRGMQQVEEFVKIARHIGTELQRSVEDNGEGEDEDEQDEDRAKNERMAELYRKDFVRSVEDLWMGYREHFRNAVGSEAALMVDLAGEAPPIVGLDEEILEKGRIPRVAYLRPVQSRDELKTAWELWRGSGVRLLGLLSEAFDQPIPFPDTLSADKNDLRTHFFSMPFATDDFLPSLSASDKLLILGTSKSFSEDLFESIVEAPAAGEAPSGVIVEINGRAFWDFCEAWLDLQSTRSALKDEMDAELDEKADEEVEPEAVPEDDLERQLEEALGERGDRRDAEALKDESDELPADDENPQAMAIEEVEGIDGIVGAEVDRTAEAVMEALDLDGDISWSGMLRQGIDHARWFQGASYRRWLDNGVPRSSCRIHWGDPTSPQN